MVDDKVERKSIHEKSPYLLQHAHNQVGWSFWDEEAFQKVGLENKPIPTPKARSHEEKKIFR